MQTNQSKVCELTKNRERNLSFMTLTSTRSVNKMMLMGKSAPRHGYIVIFFWCTLQNWLFFHRTKGSFKHSCKQIKANYHVSRQKIETGERGFPIMVDITSIMWAVSSFELLLPFRSAPFGVSITKRLKWKVVDSMAIQFVEFLAQLG